jgi:hypothetical protein
VKSFCEAEVSIYTNFRFVIKERDCMKKRYYAVFAFIIFAIGTGNAQEFKIPVIFSGNSGNGQQSRTATFGFDANASDSMTDVQWNETYPPPFDQPGDLSIRLTNRILGRSYLGADGNDGGPVDIRRKPNQDSFILQYEILTNASDFGAPINLSWNNSAIPPIVRHIFIAGEGSSDHKVRIDMVKDNTFTIPARLDSSSLYSTLLITLYYN